MHHFSKPAVVWRECVISILSDEHVIIVFFTCHNVEVCSIKGTGIIFCFLKFLCNHMWYVPFFSAIANGDPHFTTLDGKTYTFNGWGEYKVFQQQLDSTFLFQARTAPIVNTSATQFVGFAFGSIGSDYVEVSY